MANRARRLATDGAAAWKHKINKGAIHRHIVIGIDLGFTAAEADCGEAGYLWPCYLRALILTTPVRMRLQLFAVKSHTSPASESK